MDWFVVNNISVHITSASEKYISNTQISELNNDTERFLMPVPKQSVNQIKLSFLILYWVKYGRFEVPLATLPSGPSFTNMV